MKITRRQLRKLINEAVNKTKKFVKKPGGRAKAVEEAKYGDPKKNKDLAASLKKDHGEIKYCKTCSAYDTSEEAKAKGLASKTTGFCHMYGFSCKATNSCTRWYKK